MLAAPSTLTVDRLAHSILLTRTFNAPAGQIFDAWTQPEQIKCWWDPTGEPLSACEIDLRVGGEFSFVSKSPSQHAFCGVYLEIAPPDRLVFQAMGATGTVSLRQTDDQTRMAVEIACQSAEHLDQFLQMGVDAGTARTLDNLGAHIQAADR